MGGKIICIFKSIQYKFSQELDLQVTLQVTKLSLPHGQYELFSCTQVCQTRGSERCESALLNSFLVGAGTPLWEV